MRHTYVYALVGLLGLAACGGGGADIAPKPPTRFQEYERISFPPVYARPGEAVIFLDMQTGVRYLYIWGGVGNGGPALTRLWEKPSEEPCAPHS